MCPFKFYTNKWQQNILLIKVKPGLFKYYFMCKDRKTNNNKNKVGGVQPNCTQQTLPYQLNP